MRQMLAIRGHGLLGYKVFAVVVLALLLIALPACHRKGPSTGGPANGQSTFASPEDAGKALVDAAANDNQSEMTALFGPDSKSLIYSGNADVDRQSFKTFAAAYNRVNRWRQLENGDRLLLVGVSNTAFPIPLKKDSSGKWFFDTPSGKTELVNREIGRNELAAIDICATLADAQAEYFAEVRDGGQKQYAHRMISEPGTENGLYWPQQPGKPKSPIGPLLAYASDQGLKLNPSLHKPYHGYYFGILTTQGPYADGGLRDYSRGGIMNRGFGFVAYPANYGVSGVMTFVINQDRIVFQKDLGEATKTDAAFTRQFNPGPGWTEVKE
jgi:predicted small lipoprotein YifL